MVEGLGENYRLVGGVLHVNRQNGHLLGEWVEATKKTLTELLLSALAAKSKIVVTLPSEDDKIRKRLQAGEDVKASEVSPALMFRNLSEKLPVRVDEDGKEKPPNKALVALLWADEEGRYDVTILKAGLMSSEAVTLAEAVKAVMLNDMGLNLFPEDIEQY